MGVDQQKKGHPKGLYLLFFTGDVGAFQLLWNACNTYDY